MIACYTHLHIPHHTAPRRTTPYTAKLSIYCLCIISFRSTHVLYEPLSGFQKKKRSYQGSVIF